MQDDSLISANEFCVHHHIEINFIYSLQEFGLVEIINEGENIFIAANHIGELEKYVRLHYELNINMEGIDVIQRLLKKIEATQREMSQLRNQLSFYQPYHY
jgi:hypothetical protein